MNSRGQDLHPRSVHHGRYDFDALCLAHPALAKHLRPNPTGDHTIDFGDSSAVLSLNAALLAHYYGIANWRIPPGYLCPPIPGRADYVHYLADLLPHGGDGKTPRGNRIKILDVGTGANMIYPIVGTRSYGWDFVGSEIDPTSIASAKVIIDANPTLLQSVSIVRQKDPTSVLNGIIGKADRFAATMCNPPYHASADEAQSGSLRKVRNLAKGKEAIDSAALNFGGQANELWCPGGEMKFIKVMIQESAAFANQVGWFTTLVSKGDHLPTLKRAAKKAGAQRVQIIPMHQGHKQSRFLAWSYEPSPKSRG